MKTKHLVIIGVLVFAVSLLLSAPIALLQARLLPPTGATQLSGLDGTLSEGHAASLLRNGRGVASNLHWQFRPLSLLLGRATFRIDGSGENTFDGKISQLIGGAINLDAVRAAGPLKNLLALTGDVAVPVDGRFGLMLDHAQIRKGFLTRAEGELHIDALRWTLAKEPPLLGDFLAKISTEKGVVIAKLEPSSGPLDVGGEVRLLADRNFEIDVRVKPKPTAEPLVQNLVRSLGQPDTEGWFHVRSRGQL